MPPNKIGEFAAPPVATHKAGRPPKPDRKVAIKLRLDPDILAALRTTGAGWQTRINEILRRAVMP
jgi:uncharacterized protein (DUF4415 family)